MVDPHALASFSVAAFVLIVVPGPSVLFVVSRGVALGRRAAVVTAIGNAVGIYMQVVAVALGVGAIIERSVVLLGAIRLLGAAYLVYLGVRAVRHRRALSSVLDVGGRAPERRNLALEGFLVGVSNPKWIVFYTAILPQFVDPAGAPVALQMLALGAIAVGIAVVSDSAWGMVAGTARSWLARSPRRLEALGGVGGLTMIGLGVRLAATGRKD
ncbi:MAG TPA: LysE family translocator [Acidimicrobiales bacterium]|nr:LysE family translocator [Acidimicrobiales bacterium]